MADEDKLVKAGVEAALKPFADLLEKLAGPAFEELGLTWKDHIRVFRLKRQLRLFQRTKEMLEEAGVEAKQVPLKLLVPIMESGSLEEDDIIQDKWAALLANAANRRSVHPSFPEILKELSEKEVLYLDACFAYTEGKHEVKEKKMRGVERKQRYQELDEKLYLTIGRCLDLNTEDPAKARAWIVKNLSNSAFQINMVRLGLLHPSHYFLDHILTVFGFSFVKGCRPPRSGGPTTNIV